MPMTSPSSNRHPARRAPRLPQAEKCFSVFMIWRDGEGLSPSRRLWRAGISPGGSLGSSILDIPSTSFSSGSRVPSSLERESKVVSKGGHDVPEAIVRRRYARGLRNFFDLYQPLATTWRMYDNSIGRFPQLIAAGRHRTTTLVTNMPTWERIQRGTHGDE